MTEPVPLGHFGVTLLRNWLLIAAGTLLGLAIGFGGSKLVPPTYTATATQLVKGIPGAGVAANYEAAQYAVSRAKSYPSLIDSLTVLEGVRSDLGRTESIDQLRSELAATNPVDTPLVQVTATGPSAANARDKSNAAAKYLEILIKQVETVNGKTPVSVETVVVAGLPSTPSAPRPTLWAAVGAAVGMVVSIFIALLREFMPQLHSVRGRHRARTGSTMRHQPGRHALADRTDVAAETSGQPTAVHRDPVEAGPPGGPRSDDRSRPPSVEAPADAVSGSSTLGNDGGEDERSDEAAQTSINVASSREDHSDRAAISTRARR